MLLLVSCAWSYMAYLLPQSLCHKQGWRRQLSTKKIAKYVLWLTDLLVHAHATVWLVWTRQFTLIVIDNHVFMSTMFSCIVQPFCLFVNISPAKFSPPSVYVSCIQLVLCQTVWLSFYSIKYCSTELPHDPVAKRLVQRIHLRYSINCVICIVVHSVSSSFFELWIWQPIFTIQCIYTGTRLTFGFQRLVNVYQRILEQVFLILWEKAVGVTHDYIYYKNEDHLQKKVLNNATCTKITCGRYQLLFVMLGCYFRYSAHWSVLGICWYVSGGDCNLVATSMIYNYDSWYTVHIRFYNWEQLYWKV